MKRLFNYKTWVPFSTLLFILFFAPGAVNSQQVLLTTSVPAEKSYSKEITSLIKHFESKEIDIKPLLEDPRFELYEGISKRFTGSAEKKSVSLNAYKKILGFEAKKRQIGDFMTTYASELNSAEEEYGIPKYVISAILGVESSFGQVSGKYNPFSVYVSMYSENYRADFALAQLEELLAFVENREMDVFNMKSSYAGAMTHAQFIPYSLNHWFVGDDIHSMQSSIYSVANYLAHFKDVTGSVEQAVYRYNPSELYTNAVLDLAKEAELLYAKK